MNRRRSFWKRTCEAILLIGMAAAGYVLGLHAGREEHAGRADFSTYTPEELSWVAEGIMEEISELRDDLREIRGMQGFIEEGPVTIYTMDGNVWGYYGNLDIIIHDDGSAEAVLNDAWLVGTTDEDFY